MVKVFEPPVFCYHEIVHNRWVVEAFSKAGVVFVDSIEEVPEGAPLMLSAHGSPPSILAAAGEKAGFVVDAVCPLVTKVHHELSRLSNSGYDVLYVGHVGHDEAIGTVAVAPEAITLIEPESSLEDFDPKDPTKVGLLAQTTLALHEWEKVLERAREKYPDIATARKSDLCYATTNRQHAVREMAAVSDVILVVGSGTSSNTRALVRVASAEGTPAYRIESASEIDTDWISEARVVGVTAGASAPDHLVWEVVEAVNPTSGFEIFEIIREGEYFPPPPRLRALLEVLDNLLRAMMTVQGSSQPGPLDTDREWSASAALASLDVLSS